MMHERVVHATDLLSIKSGWNRLLPG